MSKKIAKNKIRLPENVHPLNYDIKFDIDLEKCIFSGSETIELQMDKPSAQVIMHSSGLKISNAAASFMGKNIQAKIKTDEKKEQLILTFNKKLGKGTRLSLDFAGQLGDNLIGLYRSKYNDNGNDRYMATTQFEATYARRAFPCFDEPEQKATFDITIIVKDVQAISNMPVKREKKENGKTIFVFERTPKMSTYLLYLAAGNFDILEGKKGNTIVRIITPPGKKNQAGLALDLTKKFLEYFEKYSGIPYPLPKLDMIAIPDFASGAMENWGAITFRETALLFDKKETSIAVKKRIAMIIAHELWHQWSGNLVTMEWWNDLWLNESFATYMAYKAVDSYFPEWSIMEDFIMDEMDAAFDEDSVISTHPIEMPVVDPSQMEEIFDAISYNKGGSVLRMLESYIGEEKFRKSVSSYLKRHKYGNAKASDLWNALAEKDKTVKEMAVTWIKQPGFPLVSAKMNKNTLELSQKRFVFNKKDNSLWPIPLTIKTDKKILTELMDTRQKKIPLKTGIFKLNHDQKGFYRVKYDEKDLPMLVDLIAGKKLSPIDRWGIESDMFRVCRHGEMTIAKYMDFAKAYCDEDNYLVLDSIYGSMHSIYFVFSGEAFWPNIWPEFRNIFYGTFDKILEEYGWEPKENETEKEALLRHLAIRFMGFVQDEKAQTRAKEKFDSYTNGGKLHPNIRSAIFATVAGCDNQSYDKLIAIYEKSDIPEEKRQVLAALGHFKDTRTLEKALDFSISEQVRKQDIFVTFMNAASNPAARPMLFEWTKKNWKQLEQYKRSHRLLLYIVGSLITAYVTEEKKNEIKEFFRTHPVDYKMTLAKSFDRVERNIAWLKNNGEILKTYFV